MVLENLVIELGMILDIVLAAFFGLLIGLEREGGKKGAGARTFSLICMGSAIFTTLSIHGFPTSDHARVAAQIVTGVGFIGAGVIWRQQEDIVHGITTAAGIWVAAAVGVTIALDFYLTSFIATLLTMEVLSRGHPFEKAKRNIPSLLSTSKKDGAG